MECLQPSTRQFANSPGSLLVVTMRSEGIYHADDVGMSKTTHQPLLLSLARGLWTSLPAATFRGVHFYLLEPALSRVCNTLRAPLWSSVFSKYVFGTPIGTHPRKKSRPQTPNSFQKISDTKKKKHMFQEETGNCMLKQMIFFFENHVPFQPHLRLYKPVYCVRINRTCVFWETVFFLLVFHRRLRIGCRKA